MTNTPTPEIAPAVPIQEAATARLGWRKLVASAVLGVGAVTFASVGTEALDAPASANVAVLSADSHSKLSNKQLYDRCLTTRIVNHKGDHSRRGPDVDTMPWIKHTLSIGNWVETNLQHGAGSKPHGWLYHDRNLRAESNGTGDLSHRSNGYLANVRTVHRQHLGQYPSLLSILHQNPSKRAQLEWKDYAQEWTKEQVWQYMQMQVDRGVQSQIYDSSFWPAVLRNIKSFENQYNKANPTTPINTYTEFIGQPGQRPSLAQAKELDVDQININFQAAFKPTANFSSYAAAVLAHGFNLSIRSNANGDGDSAYWWRRELRANVTALVVQGHSKAQVCDAVRG